MAPVSVIHHVSNTRLSYTSLDHLITSGLSGSPTDKIERNDDDHIFTTSSPALINILNAVGAVYQIVTLNVSIMLYHCSGRIDHPLYNL